MEETSNEAMAAETIPMKEVIREINQGHDEAITDARKQVESLVRAITVQADTATSKMHELERAIDFSVTSRTEIDSQLAAIKEATGTFTQQLEAAKPFVAELTTLQNSVQTTCTQTIELKGQAVSALESLRTFISSATESANRVEAIKAEAESTQGVIATKSQHIEDGRLHTDEVRAKIDRLLTEAQQSATNAEAQHQASHTASDNLASLYAAAQTVKSNTDSNADFVEKLRKQCEEHAITTRKLVDIAEASEKKVAAYETKLAEFEQTAADRLKTIEHLLPSAASAGLASAFNQRRAHFKLPQRFWQTVFIASLLVLLGLGIWELVPLSNNDSTAKLTWDLLAISLLHRLPIVLPLIWLAFHASHKAALAQRVEEDYAFKETVSRAFEGYRREMADLGDKATPQSALLLLCEGVLNVITNPPGRIYEKHKLITTPLSAVAESARPLSEAAAKIMTPQVKIG